MQLDNFRTGIGIAFCTTGDWCHKWSNLLPALTGDINLPITGFVGVVRARIGIAYCTTDDRARTQSNLLPALTDDIDLPITGSVGVVRVVTQFVGIVLVNAKPSSMSSRESR